jgi:hypothetical protein
MNKHHSKTFLGRNEKSTFACMQPAKVEVLDHSCASDTEEPLTHQAAEKSF